jgi:hypothetical protein
LTTPEPRPVRTPIGITLVALESAILGLFLVAVTLAYASRLRLWPIELLLGSLYVVVSLGLWERRRWAWGLCLLVNLASIIDDIVQPVLMQTTIGGSIEGLVIDSLIVAYLITPSARAFFFPRTTASPPS